MSLPAFVEFLSAQKLSRKTIRNYASDVSQFLAWRDEQGSSLSDKDDPFQDYKVQLQSRCSAATLTRHLAALRQYARFLGLELNLDNPPLPLIPTVLKNFHYHLKQRRYKSKTVANYLSDVKHYLAWYESR